MDALLAAGVDVFRINSSHGTRDDRRGMVGAGAEPCRAGGRHRRVLEVLEDLAGPKIRIGSLADPDGVELEVGARLRIAVGDFPGDAELGQSSCECVVVGADDCLPGAASACVRAVSDPLVAHVSFSLVWNAEFPAGVLSSNGTLCGPLGCCRKLPCRVPGIPSSVAAAGFCGSRQIYIDHYP